MQYNLFGDNNNSESMYESSATISLCKRYRYVLKRFWDPNKKNCIFIGLNPSTADANINDPTIKKCISFADSFGCGGFVMLNLFAYRATNPFELIDNKIPVIGESNNRFLNSYCLDRKYLFVICCWGNGGKYLRRDEFVLQMLKNNNIPFYSIGNLTKEGCPPHPLYLKSDTKLERML